MNGYSKERKMTKVFNQIKSAIYNNQELTIKSRNAETSEYGARYKVRVNDGKVEVRYWNSLVAAIDKERHTVTILDCGWRTMSTKRVINNVLDAFCNLFSLPPTYIYSNRGRWVVRQGENEIERDWNGSGLVIG